MGFLDVFKKKDEFDDLLKEPEGGNWDDSANSSALEGDDFLGQSSAPDPLLGQNPSTDPLLGQSGDVMGLPNQSDGGMGMNDSSVPNFNDEGSFSSNNTSASTLNLNTNSSESPKLSADNNHNYTTYQTPAQEPPANNHGGLSSHNQEFDLIITKLDLLKSTLQNLDNRIYHIEKKILDEPYNKNRW